MATPVEAKSLSRRSFLKKTGWVAAGLTVTAAFAYPFVRAAMPVLPTFGDPAPEDALTWIQAMPDGSIRFFCPRIEMGQGAGLGLTQVVAEELNVGPSEITCVAARTDQVPPFKMTVGSESIRNFFQPVSTAAAQLREALRAIAARETGLQPGQIKDARAGFELPDGTELTYAALVPSEPLILPAAGLTLSEQAPPRYALQRGRTHQAIGGNWKHPDLEAIVTGQMVYSRDVALDGMAYGQVLRPPAFGARVKSVDAGAAEAMPGIDIVVVDEGNDFVGVVNFVGVVSDNPFALPAAIDAIDVQWDMPSEISQDRLDARLDVARARADDDFEHTLAEDGDISTGRDGAAFRAAAGYATPFAAHAAMEPRAAVAWVRDSKVDVWCGSQDPFFVQRRVAKVTDRNVDDVVVNTQRLGGGFGGRIPCQAAEEAAILSAATGRPIRVQWDRESEFLNNYFHPAFSHHIDAGITNDGMISHWEHDYVSSPIATGPMPRHIATVADLVVADFGTSRGSLPPYRLANRRIRYSDIRTAVPTGAWRGLGAGPHAFAIESMIDELAALAGIDPLEVRLKNLPPEGERLANVLRRVADISGWPAPAEPNTGRGLACAVYKDETPVAVVANVIVDHQAREIRVTEVWCVQDCGLVINPDQVENLVMGNIVWGTSMALKEQIAFEPGNLQYNNFHSYEILRHGESPDMTVELIQSDAPPVGVGESALAPVAPAIANAVFAATGQRIRRLPLSYEDIAAGSGS